ncbi:MAG: ABC transporter permease [Solirubrobacterales bacterium]
MKDLTDRPTTSGLAPPAPSPEGTRRRLLDSGRAVDLLRDYSILAFLALVFLILTLTSSVFLTTTNLENVLDQSVAVGLVSCAGALVIIAGGFDLSAGAIYVLAAVIAAKVTNSSGSAELGILAGLAAGTALGAVNAIICTVGRINPFVGTLATSIFFGGAAVAITGGGFVIIEDPSFGDLSSQVAGIKVSILIFAAFALFCAFLLNRTVLGRRLLATGDNVDAARLSGIRTGRVQASTYMLSGFSAALAGVVVASRSLAVASTSASANALIFSALGAILVGGISLYGGSGAIWRVLVGVFILALISNGFNLNGVDPLYQQMMTGVLILAAVAADVWVRRRTR